MRQRLISIRHHEEAFMSIGTINFGEFYQLEKVINRTICNLFVLKLPRVTCHAYKYSSPPNERKYIFIK